MGHLAGLTRAEVSHLPLGVVFDQIACYQIMHGARERRRPTGSLFEQMQHVR
jgi:hypothetical protein